MNRSIWAATLLFVGAGSAWAQSDTIRMRDPNEADITCEILEMSWKEVKYNIFAGDTLVAQTRPSRDIREVVFGNYRKPFEFGSAEQNIGDGQYEAAVDRLRKVLRDTRCPEPVKQLASITIARCYLWNRQPERAISAIADLRKDFPNTYYLADSFALQYEAYRAKSPPDIANMEKTLNEFGREAETKNRDWGKAAEIMRGELFEFQEKWNDALSIHRKYVADPVVGKDARLGEMRCLYAKKSWAELRTKAESILTESKTNKKMDPQLKAGAYVGLGDALVNSGKVKDGLFEYLRVVEVMRGQVEGTREHEAAIAKAAIACARLASELQDSAQKATYKGRARELQRDLVNLFPGSTWGKVVEEEIRR